jgi:hypothetical protein
MQMVARCNEMVLLEDGPRLIIAERETVSATLLFVLGLVSFILGANAVVWLVVGLRGGGTLILGACMAGGALVVGLGLRLALRRRRQAAAAPPVTMLVLDRASGTLTDAGGRPLAALAQVGFATQLQLGSSSRALACRWPGGSTVIARGNPFGDSVDDFVDALAKAGFRTA